jgi:hypothetical protein
MLRKVAAVEGEDVGWPFPQLVTFGLEVLGHGVTLPSPPQRRGAPRPGSGGTRSSGTGFR